MPTQDTTAAKWLQGNAWSAYCHCKKSQAPNPIWSTPNIASLARYSMNFLERYQLRFSSLVVKLVDIETREANSFQCNQFPRILIHLFDKENIVALQVTIYSYTIRLSFQTKRSISFLTHLFHLLILTSSFFWAQIEWRGNLGYKGNKFWERRRYSRLKSNSKEN